jgi:hypothetical protein
MIFDTEQQQSAKEKLAIETFSKVLGCSYQRLIDNDLNCKLIGKSGELIGYAHIISRVRTMYMAYPLPVETKKIIKLIDKRITPYLIWACEDGIIYGKPTELKGAIKFDLPAPDAIVKEIMTYYEKQRGFGYIRYK